MKVHRRTLPAWLNLLVLLSLVLSAAAPALAQEPPGGAQASPATAGNPVSPSGQSGPASASALEPIDCSKPLPGQKVTLAEDLEILAAVSDFQEIKVDRLNNKSNTDTHLVYDWTWYPDTYDFYQPLEQALTTGDVDGDGKAEVIGAFVNDHNQMLEAYYIQNPEAAGGDLVYNLWGNDDNNRQGDNVSWVAAAAGNLDGAAGGDEADEVVVAFQDDAQNLQVVLLNNASGGGIGQEAWWTSSANHRSQPSDIAVAVGDLDGDGYDNEIVLAFSDAWGYLQIVVLKYMGSGVFSELGWDYWTDTGRHGAQYIHVATGDFQGDPRDDIAVGFRDGSGWLQVMAVVYDPSGSTAQDRVNSTGYWRDSGNYRDNVHELSLAAGDIDGDGWDEIVTAIGNRIDRMQIITYSAQSGAPQPRGFYWNDSGNREEVQDLSVAAGDLDGDGKAEVAVALIDNVSYMEVLSLDDNPNCPCGESGENGLTWRDSWTHEAGNGTQLPAIALGDVDGNNLYADYTGQCQQTDETRLISMVGRPPLWESLNPDTDVGYGSSIKGGDEEEDHITNSYGGSATFDASFDFANFRLGPSFTKEWDHSVTQSWTNGSSQETKSGWTSPEDGLVSLNTVTYYAYQYKKRDGTGLARVSIPVATQTDAKKMSFWNQTGGGRALFPASWVPAYRSGWEDVRSASGGTIGTESQGAGADFYDINGNGKPDYLFAWIDNPAGENVIHYRIGWDVGGDGSPTSWSAIYQMPDPSNDGVGWETADLGVAVTDLNGNGSPELVVAWVANPEGDNWAAYRIGWDLDANGAVASWSGKKGIPGSVGSSTEGVGLATADINHNGRPELFFGWIDAPGGDNNGYYRVGWDLDKNGDSSNWWTNPKEIEGVFGSNDAGLGLTVADMDGNGQLELIAAWVRDLQGEHEWAYAIGENLDGNAYVESWTPGPRIAGWVGSSTAGVALASANLVTADDTPELVVSWIDDPVGDNEAWLRVGKLQDLGGEVDQSPTAIDDTDPDDGYFRMQLYDQWWNVSGKVLWRWDGTQGNDPIYVSVGGGNPYWEVTHDQFSAQTTEESESYNYTVGGEAEFLGVGYDGSSTEGFEQGHSDTISWETGFFMDGQSSGLPFTATLGLEYQYVPYTYMAEADSNSGVQQGYMVLDYFVPWRGSDAACNPADCGTTSAAPAVKPGLPIVASPTHPDPDTWYPANSVVFTWAQPAGDPAVVDGYRWYLDHAADTVPSPVSLGLMNTTTYEGLSDGLWYLHLRARDASGEWGEAAHRAVRVDTHPPQVEIALDPSYPVDNGGWYNTPVTATVTATDTSTSPGQAGSGVQGIEVSADGLTWQPYAAPLTFATETPHTELWARATDRVGHVSEPVSVTFALDLTRPDTVEGVGCWLPGGGCAAGVITDTVGNQRLHLSGQLGASLSEVEGVSIQINELGSTSADEIVDTRWAFTSTTGLGAGCYSFSIQSGDRAGNVEQPHAFGRAVAWHPRGRPDLSGSRLAVAPARVRPGETVTVTLAVPNSNWQETWAPVAVRLPAGLRAVTRTIGAGGVYDPASGTITWPPDTLWPGRERRFTFNAQVAAGTPAANLALALTAVGTWPITASCPADALPGFQQLQTTVAVTTTLAVDPALPSGIDVLPPASPFLTIKAGQVTHSRDLELGIQPVGSADAQRMYLREWTWSSAEGRWVVAQESGWLPYAPTYRWTLSAGDGVKYLGVWGADEAWNISALDRSSLAFTNLLQGSQFLADGERVQYRFQLLRSELAIFGATALMGDPNLYVWQPRNGFRPDYAATGTGVMDAVGFSAIEGGLYLVEVKAEGDSRYQLLLGGDIGPRGASAASIAPSPPEHPLTVSDPLSAGAAVAPAPPAFPKLYLPIVMRSW